MSFFDASMEPMLEVFIFETSTLLEQLDEIMLESEKSKSMREESINEIFRIMHTIKGSSAMMGVESMSKLAHNIEDMFFIVRETPSKMNADASNIFDLVFQSSDYFKSEVDRIQSDPNYTPADSSALIALLAAQTARLNGTAAPEPAAALAPSEAEDISRNEDSISPDTDLFQVRVFFEDDCQMENIRAFMLISQLQEVCEIVETVPPNPEANADLCAEIIKNGLLVKFKATDGLAEVESLVSASTSVKSYEFVEPTEAAEAAPPQAGDAPVQAAVSDFGSAPVAAPAAAAGAAAPAGGGKQSLISVNQAKLDQLVDIVGEIVIAESMVASNPELKGLHLDNFYKATRQLRKLTDELQDVVMSIRMVPLSGVFQKMNRIVRDMSKKLGKNVELVTVGGDTEVDKTINDVIADPFMHMIRNAMDHAMESPADRLAAGKAEMGQITMSAHNVGGEIVITIADDGRGLKAEQILEKAKRNGMLTKAETEYSEKEIFSMIMLPGFSTNEQVTEYSGRGVGMDVVRKNIEKVGGSVSVESKRGQGTTFIIKIPLTLAIVDGMEVSVGNTVFTVPITSIKQSFKLSDETQVLYDTDGSEMIMVRGECYPVIRLHRIYNLESQITDLADGIIIILENEKKESCLFVDELLGEQQVVVKPFPTYLSKYDVKGNGLSGCTILGDGSISLIVDANNLLNHF